MNYCYMSSIITAGTLLVAGINRKLHISKPSNVHIMNRKLSIISIIAFFAMACMTSCGGGSINSIQDPNFGEDGEPYDTLTIFTPAPPQSVKLYIETSGSMNGFFRANQANKFKKTVWSVFSGVLGLTDGNVYPMSNGGDIDTPVRTGDFRAKMNKGEFVSNTSTHIPAMLINIIQNMDTTKNEVAILVSDMKYSPMGADAAPQLSQYQEQIRNIVFYFPNISISFVCAGSEFIGKSGQIEAYDSPYYFIILGKSESVAAVRNDISRWCEASDSYIESGDMAMNYHTPDFSILDVKNGMLHSSYKTVITTFDREVSDTCSFVLRVKMEGYPWSAVDENILESCLDVKTVYGSSVSAELLKTPDHLVDDHHYKNEFKRMSYADFLVKLYNVALDDEVIECTFNNRPFDGLYVNTFNSIITAKDENDITGSFSFDKFIEGCFNARLNTSDEKPIRILVSSSQE